MVSPRSSASLASPASPRSGASRNRVAFVRTLGVSVAACALCVGLGGCDEKPAPKPTAATSASAPPAPPPAPEAPAAPVLSMDDKALSVSGTTVPFDAPDVPGRLAAALSGKPKVAGEPVSLAVVRSAKAPKVAQVVAALRGAKAAAVVVKAQKRDGGMGELTVAWPSAPPCTAVAYLGKDVSISVWTAGGTVAKRFAKGMAGPDMTLGSEGLRKVAGACESPVALLAADESVTFGLLFDLALATRESEDARVAGLKFGLPAEAPVPGRKVTP